MFKTDKHFPKIKPQIVVAVVNKSQFLVILKWLRWQKCRQNKKTMRQKDFEKKDEIVYKSVFVYLNM